MSSIQNADVVAAFVLIEMFSPQLLTSVNFIDASFVKLGPGHVQIRSLDKFNNGNRQGAAFLLSVAMPPGGPAPTFANLIGTESVPGEA